MNCFTCKALTEKLRNAKATNDMKEASIAYDQMRQHRSRVKLPAEHGFINEEIINAAEDCVLGKAKLSANYQFALIAEVRPWVHVKPGQSIQYRRLRNGMVIIELSVDDKEGGE